MNIELDEVVVQDVSDDALELAAGGAQGGFRFWSTLNLLCIRTVTWLRGELTTLSSCCILFTWLRSFTQGGFRVLAIADR